ncbi:gag-pol polyprotein, partial [Tanacetum coccineum]
MSMSARKSQAQDGKGSQDDDLRLCLADDLKKAQDHIQAFKIATNMSMSVQMSQEQDGKGSQDDDLRLCLADDLKNAQITMTVIILGENGFSNGNSLLIQPELDKPERDQTIGDDLKQYEADIEEMYLILISIPNDIYNSVDACQTAKEMWLRVKRLMQGTELSEIDTETRFNNEFGQFTFEAEESLTSYEKLVIASRAKKAAKTHDPLALVAHTSSSSSRSPPPYNVTHPPSVVDYDDDYQGETFGDDQEDNITSAMMLYAREITQRYSTPTNNRLCTSSNTSNQAVVQADRVNIQSKNVGNGGRIARRSYNTQEAYFESSNVQKETRNVQRILRTSSSGNATNVQCYNCDAKGHYARDCLKPRVQDSKYFMEQMLLAKKDEVEHNDFFLA